MPEEPLLSGTRSYWGALHLLSAANLARQSYRLEQEILHGNRGCDHVYQHRACVTGAVFTSVAFLESTANELFADAVDSSPLDITHLGVRFTLPSLVGLDDAAIDKLARLWNLGIPKRASYSVTDKFEVALAALDKEPFNRGAPSFQNVKLLIMLRNEWIHYEPAWHRRGDHPVRRHRIEALKGLFPPNPQPANPGEFTLHQCVSHGCAEWSVKSSIAFADEFFRKTGIRANYQQIRSKLVTS